MFHTWKYVKLLLNTTNFALFKTYTTIAFYYSSGHYMCALTLAMHNASTPTSIAYTLFATKIYNILIAIGIVALCYLFMPYLLDNYNVHSIPI